MRHLDTDSRDVCFCWHVGQVAISWCGWLMASQRRSRGIFFDHTSVTRWTACVILRRRSSGGSERALIVLTSWRMVAVAISSDLSAMKMGDHPSWPLKVFVDCFAAATDAREIFRSTSPAASMVRGGWESSTARRLRRSFWYLLMFFGGSGMLPWLSGLRFQSARFNSTGGGFLYSGGRIRLRC